MHNAYKHVNGAIISVMRASYTIIHIHALIKMSYDSEGYDKLLKFYISELAQLNSLVEQTELIITSYSLQFPKLNETQLNQESFHSNNHNDPSIEKHV